MGASGLHEKKNDTERQEEGEMRMSAGLYPGLYQKGYLSPP